MDIFIGGLSYDLVEEDLYLLFSQYGNVQSVEIVIDLFSGRSMGFGFISMRPKAAESAIARLHGSEFHGRRLTVNRKRPLPKRPFRLNSHMDGKSIVDAAAHKQRRFLKIYSNRPEALRYIDRRRFEELIAEIFRLLKYDVELTRRTRDGGTDIVVVKHKQFHEKFLIECKRPDVGRPIGVRTVRELYGVKISEGATKAILVTTARFTRDAKLFLEKHKWELEGISYDDIMEWFSRVRGELYSQR